MEYDILKHTEMGYKLGPRLRESRLLVVHFGRGARVHATQGPPFSPSLFFVVVSITRPPKSDSLFHLGRRRLGFSGPKYRRFLRRPMTLHFGAKYRARTTREVKVSLFCSTFSTSGNSLPNPNSPDPLATNVVCDLTESCQLPPMTLNPLCIQDRDGIFSQGFFTTVEKGYCDYLGTRAKQSQYLIIVTR